MRPQGAGTGTGKTRPCAGPRVRSNTSQTPQGAAVADTWGVRIAPHLYHELMSHLMASIPNGEMLVYEYTGMMDDLWVEPVNPENGMVRPPERPGHGLAFKPELFTEYKSKE